MTIKNDPPGTIPDPATSAGISFYHLTSTPLERALPRLVEKAYSAGHRVLVVDSLAERLEILNQVMWTYSTLTFLPHGTVSEGEPERQPILLAPTLANDNNAEIAIITDGTAIPTQAPFTRVLDVFDGNDASAVAKARARWKQYQAAGHTLSYLKQNDKGGWEATGNA